jgi:hypothetical protein
MGSDPTREEAICEGAELPKRVRRHGRSKRKDHSSRTGSSGESRSGASNTDDDAKSDGEHDSSESGGQSCGSGRR